MVVEDPIEYLQLYSPEKLFQMERSLVPFQVLINPQIVTVGDEVVEHFERCLSVHSAEFAALVPRARRIQVQCLDENAKAKVIEAQGWYARILQHEIDHLHGTLFIDRMEPRTFMTREHYLKFWQDKTIEEIRLDLGVPTSKS